MVQSNKVTTIVERIKWNAERLSNQEREMLRDELLTMLLFKDFNEGRTSAQGDNNTFSGLSDSEKELIKKLADQTEQLYKLSRKDRNQNS